MQSEVPSPQHSEFSPAIARREFASLVTQYRDTALWYMKPDMHLDLSDPVAAVILDSISEKESRTEWLAIRKLKKWRSLHFNVECQFRMV